jgi:uncharacterized protein YndB with AHSA1/START domain
MMRTTLAAVLALVAAPLAAEVTESNPNGFVSTHSGLHAGKPQAAWAALLDWAGWWPDAHTYSGKAENLELDVEADGELEENWDDNSVLHASVVQAQTAKLLRLNGGFGPLQALPVNAVMDFALKPEGTGTRITATYRVGGPAFTGLPALAAPVDTVLAEAFTRLLGHTARPDDPKKAKD